MFDCCHAPIALPDDEVAALAARYGEPHRAYHTAAHIGAMLRWFDAVIDDGPSWIAPADVYLAVLYHDAIYDARAHDNEARSADLVRARSPRAAALVELTARHGKLAAADLGDDADAAHFLDSDLSILGAPPAVFDRYDAGVRTEYAHVPDAAFVAGRGAFLRSLAATQVLYFTDFFRTRLEAAARANLARAIARYDGDRGEFA